MAYDELVALANAESAETMNPIVVDAHQDIAWNYVSLMGAIFAERVAQAPRDG